MSFFTKLFGEESVKENTSNINKNLKNNSTILNNKLAVEREGLEPSTQTRDNR